MKKLCKPVSILLSFIMIFSLFTIIPLNVSAADGVEYIERSWDGEKIIEEVRTCTDYTELSGRASDELSNGKYAVSHDMTVDSRLYVTNGSADLILCDGATLTLTSGITVRPQARLNIYGQSNATGKIYAHMPRGSSYYECAVIGGDKNENSGNIYIYGATLDLDNGEGNYEVINGYDGACIGGGNGSGAGEVVIYGGNVKVNSLYAAGIGGGKNGQASWKTGESIRIYGGKVDAYSYEGAAIGNGALHNGSAGGIAIYGGEVTANGKASGAGIGGGGNIEVGDAGGSNGPITIYGGVIAASGTGGKYCGAGIGSGGRANQGEPIRILGGTVTSISDRGAGIGSGANGNAGKIEISNANVVAVSSAWGAGIGGGNEGSSGEIIISDSNVSAVSCNYGSAQDFLNSFDKMVTYRKMKSNDQAFLDSALNTIALLVELFQREYSGAAIGGGRHGSGGKISIINSTVEAECGNYAAAIGGGQGQSFDTITIDHSTIVKANSGCDGAGIGSGDEASDGGGTIRIINGSDVKATAGTDAAGIGTGDECRSPCAEIVISDSTVEAHGGRYGAGIGGGDAVSGGRISISNSTVTADSITDGAGIGGGESGSGGTVIIKNNSNVSATGGGYAAGIGGGDHADGGNITIENSTVKAYGGTDAAGIGGGENGDGGNISIYNSDVYAQGKEYGSGIGGGEDAGVSSVSITGSGSRVEALAGSVTYGGRSVAIGHGDYNSFWSSRPNVGELTLNRTLKVKSGTGQTLSSVEYTLDSRFDIMRDAGCRHILIYPCDHTQTVLAAYDIDDHRLRCVQCMEWIDDPEPHAFDDDICIDCGAHAKKITMIFVERGNSSEVQFEEKPRYNSYYVMPECTHTPDGMEFTYWRISYEYDGEMISEYYAPGQEFNTGNRNAEEYRFDAVYYPIVEASYMDEDGFEQTVTAREINADTDCFTLSSGWYYVSEDAAGTSDYDQLAANGVVNIILADGKTLRVTGDPNTTSLKGDVINLYGQSAQTGVLDCGESSSEMLNQIKQYGGKIAIAANLNVSHMTVRHGELDAYRLSNHLDYKGGNVRIGSFSLVSEENTLGWTSLTDNIRIENIVRIPNRGTITVAAGQAFTDGENIYEGKLTDGQIDSLTGKTLTPYIPHEYDNPEWIWDNEYTDATAVFRCRDCDDVQEVKAKVSVTDSGKYRTAIARCEFNGHEFSTTQTFQIIYCISVEVCEHGEVTSNKATAKPGDNIKLDIAPDDGYILASFKVTDSQNNEIEADVEGFNMPESDVTVAAGFAQYCPLSEPYIDENSAYIPGSVEHCEYNGKYYAVNNDGTIGEEITEGSLKLSYFDFTLINNDTEYQINYYTGPTDNLTELVIPKTYQGKPITVLGTDNRNAFIANSDPKPQFTLTLNENISEIKGYAFYVMWVTEVKGDTSNLKTIGDYAFSWANSPGGYTLDITLDYPGRITVGREIFNNMKVTAHIKHATTLSSTSFSARSVDYIFTDEHHYGDPVWTWADDHSSAEVTFTCTDSRCRHEEVVDAIITSETKDGIITYTATAELNGNTYNDVKTAFADGVGVRIVGHSISLDGDIAVNFYMDLSDSIIAHKDTAYMHFTIPTGSGTTEQDMLVKDARVVESGDKTYYVFKCRVAAKEMTSEIKAQMIDGENEGVIYTYSVKEYADYLLTHAHEREDLAAAAPLVKKMLNYGAYAQIYFDKNPGTLANSDLAAADKVFSDPEIDIAAPDESKLPEGVTFEGATLSLKSETTLSLYFKSSDPLEFSCDGYTVEKATSGGYQIARIRGIKAKHIGDVLTLKIGEEETISYSPLNYCKNVLDDDSTDEKLQNVVKALYAYWQVAYIYFES